MLSSANAGLSSESAINSENLECFKCVTGKSFPLSLGWLDQDRLGKAVEKSVSETPVLMHASCGFHESSLE